MYGVLGHIRKSLPVYAGTFDIAFYGAADQMRKEHVGKLMPTTVFLYLDDWYIKVSGPDSDQATAFKFKAVKDSVGIVDLPYAVSVSVPWWTMLEVHKENPWQAAPNYIGSKS